MGLGKCQARLCGAFSDCALQAKAARRSVIFGQAQPRGSSDQVNEFLDLVFMNSDEISQLKRSRFYIKSFGTTRADCRFNKLPEVVRKAQMDLDGEDIFGYFICALDRPPRMTGLLFLADPSGLPFGLPAHTTTVVRRYERAGYCIVEGQTGDLFAVAHWYFQNGALAPFHDVH